MKKFIAILIIILIVGVGAYFVLNIEEEIVYTKDDIIKTYHSNKSVWENLDSMPSNGIAGIYKTGYAFFDIDLDGEKELAVQLGGGSLHNCITNFYEFENGEIKLKVFFV